MKPGEAAEVMAGLQPLRVLKPAHREPSAKEWSRLEGALGRAIPEPFKTFIAIYNGYSVDLALFKLSNPAFAHRGGLELFYGFGVQYNFFVQLKSAKGRMPDGFLPFGQDGTGNQTCLDTNTKRGAVYYWDHELEHLGPWGCVAKAAGSFDAFLRMLKPLESK
jgi:hypothetical protein